MKKYLFLATAIATASLFTGCSNNEYVGDQPEAFNGTDGAIAFSMGKANTTRVEQEQEQAANTYFEHFYVYGEKTLSAGGSAVPVFNTYKVTYADVSTNSTASNTKGWEYVGIDWNSNERQNVAGEKATAITQTIKYWDYSASKYTFYAFSANSSDVTGTSPNIQVSAIVNTSTDPSYTVTIKKGASIGDLYFADKKEVEKNDYAGQGGTLADKAVQLKFRNLAAKVRVGFYETVPGYKIEIKRMYGAKEDGTGFESTGSTSAFVAMCPNYKASKTSKITVKYSTESENKNRAYVAERKVENDGVRQPDNTLTLGDGVFNTALNTTSSSPTWDNAGYTFFWPQTENSKEQGKPLKIKVDYTLTSTDGSLEPINVTGATATVPKEYVAWKANTAYTYIFKISDKTNGTTGEGGPEGLYPITFDAVVVDYANEGSITTVSTPSVTAKQKGTTDGYVTTDGIVFKKGETIDLKVMNGNADVTSSASITGGYITGNYDYGKTPEQNLKAHSQSQDFTTNQLNPLALQNSEGYWVLKVTYRNGETNVFTYVIIRVGDAEVGPANPANS